MDRETIEAMRTLLEPITNKLEDINLQISELKIQMDTLRLDMKTSERSIRKEIHHINDGTVSYTHLDVYKRQFIPFIQSPMENDNPLIPNTKR